MKKNAVYPGSFDPFTKGHENIVNKALEVFDEIIVGIGVNTTKSTLFSLENRMEHISSLYSNQDRLKVISYTGLTTDFCKKQQAKFIIRGLRNGKDFDYETPISQTNKILAPDIETIYLTSDLEFSYIQSTIIREIHKSGGIIDTFVTNAHILVK